MPWFKVDDGFAFHPKAIAAGNAALGLWVRAGAWCGANLTDGALPRHMIGTFGAQARHARALVEAGLWVETEAGYQFHDWEQAQPTKASVQAEREASKLRQKAFREKKSNGVSNGVTNGGTNSAPTRPDPTRPITEAKASVSAREKKKPIESEDFVEFYLAYPRHEGRGNAVKAYAKALAKTDAVTILEGAQRYADDPNRDPAFTKLPATWLNAESWSDDPLPARFSNQQPQRSTHADRVNAKHDQLIARLAGQTDIYEIGA